VEYPTACSPQVWASGTPLLLLRAILGLEPIGNNLLVDPAIPSQLGQIELLDIPGRWGRVDAFGREGWIQWREKTVRFKDVCCSLDSRNGKGCVVQISAL
jgi:hypothetical protein